MRFSGSSSYGRTIWIILLDKARQSADLGLCSTVQRSLVFLARCRVFFLTFSRDATFSRRELPPFVDEGLTRQVDFALRPSQFLIQYAAPRNERVYGRCNRNSELPIFPSFRARDPGNLAERELPPQNTSFRAQIRKNGAPEAGQLPEAARRRDRGRMKWVMRPEWASECRCSLIRPTWCRSRIDRTSPGSRLSSSHPDLAWSDEMSR